MVRRVRFRTVFYLFVFVMSISLLLDVRFQLLYSGTGDMPTQAPYVEPEPTLAPDTDEYVHGLADPRQLLDGTLNYDDHLGISDIWPSVSLSQGHDSLLEQLHFLGLLEGSKTRMTLHMTSLPRMYAHPKDKLIVITAGVSVEPWQLKREAFISENCPITNCYLMEDASDLPAGVTRPDAVVYKTAVNLLKRLSTGRLPHEVWVVWQLESPLYASMAKFSANQYPNWTATYRSDSTLVTPYDKFVTSQSLQKYRLHHLARPPTSWRRDVLTKKKLIGWFVSNCQTNSGRMNYVNELKKHIQVDTFGGCGPFKCARQDPVCSDMLAKDYKFYLSLENSNCREYITEKLYENAFGHDVVPVVMGAHPDDYRAVAPPHSYIHVDDFESPRHLADYLKLLDKNDTMYNEYFRWKGTGSFINTKFWCRLCAMLHARDQTNYVHTYTNLAHWWRNDQCILPSGPYGATWRKDGWKS